MLQSLEVLHKMADSVAKELQKEQTIARAVTRVESGKNTPEDKATRLIIEGINNAKPRDVMKELVYYVPTAGKIEQLADKNIGYILDADGKKVRAAGTPEKANYDRVVAAGNRVNNFLEKG